MIRLINFFLENSIEKKLITNLSKTLLFKKNHFARIAKIYLFDLNVDNVLLIKQYEK